MFSIPWSKNFGQLITHEVMKHLTCNYTSQNYLIWMHFPQKSMVSTRDSIFHHSIMLSSNLSRWSRHNTALLKNIAVNPESAAVLRKKLLINGPSAAMGGDQKVISTGGPTRAFVSDSAWIQGGIWSGPVAICLSLFCPGTVFAARAKSPCDTEQRRTGRGNAGGVLQKRVTSSG